VRILSRYFLVSYMKLFVAILFSSMVAVMVIEMMLNFDEVLEHYDGPIGIASYLFFRIPTHYLRDLIPVSSFAAVFFCLGLPARAREITAIKSGGISPQRIGIPLLAAAFILSGIALLLNESVVLQATREWERLKNPGEEISFRQSSFWYHRGNTVYNVREADKKSKTLYGVSVFELDQNGRLIRSIRAKQVEVGDDNRWLIRDGIERIFDPSRPADPPRTSHVSEWHRDVADEEDLAMLEASAQTLSLPDLGRYIEAQIRDGRDATRFQALYQSRLAEPLSVLLFALLAIPLALAAEQTRSLAASALYGIVVLGIFYTSRTTADMFAASGFASAIASPWVILTSFAGYGVWQLHRVPR
jgi:lipopolysaccharide export system permease protein